MTQHDDTVYVHHILDALLKIERYAQGVDYKRFIKETQIQDSIIRQLEIIGEATKHVSAGFRDKYLQIPWGKMAGMRDKLIHNYLDVDLEAVWDTATRDIPGLKEKLEQMLREIR